MKSGDLKQLTDFLAQYQILQQNPQTLILTSNTSRILVKTHILNQSIDSIMQVLDRHLSLDQEYICPILHYQQCFNSQGQKAIRAVYMLDRNSLSESIERRAQKGQRFSQADLWIILSSLVHSLVYLQQKQIAYGVITPNMIFIQDKIRLVDPSAFNLNPTILSRISIRPPELKDNQEEIDLEQSDVYFLALCILSATTLTLIPQQPCQDHIDQLLLNASEVYSEDLLHVLEHMLKQDPIQRPSFRNIIEYIQQQIQIKQAKNVLPQPLAEDREDQPPISLPENQQDQQVYDKLQIERNDLQKTNEYQQAKKKYLFTPQEDRKLLTMIDTNCNSKSADSNSQHDSSQLLEQNKTIKIKQSNYQVGQFKLINPIDTITKGKRRAQQIKNRNSQKVRTVHTVKFPSQLQNCYQVSYTHPELMSFINEQKKKARDYMADTHRSHVF